MKPNITESKRKNDLEKQQNTDSSVKKLNSALLFVLFLFLFACTLMSMFLQAIDDDSSNDSHDLLYPVEKMQKILKDLNLEQ